MIPTVALARLSPEARPKSIPFGQDPVRVTLERMRTVGVEEELLLVDQGSWSPVPVADEALRGRGRLSGSRADVALVGELHLEMLEAVTTPHRRMSALGDEVIGNRSKADALAAGVGARAVALASAPTATQAHPRQTDRYEAIVRRYGVIPKRSLTCGMHVHVSIDSESEGVAVLDRIRVWTPILIALSANSPFHRGDDTGHESFRSIDWNQWPSAGPMDVYGSAERYRAVERGMLRTGALLDAGMLYLDARLSRNHPTVEIRVADVPLDAGTTVVIAAIVRALVDTAVREWRSGDGIPDVPACTVRLANWRAALEGLHGELVDPLSWEAAPAHAVVAALLAHVMPALRANGDDRLVTDGLARLLAHHGGADVQRDALRSSGDLAGVVQVAVTHTHADPVGWMSPVPA
jgi:carboxylate-amine ligase